uniref:Hflx-type G domain-containing protein n=1 Tax=Tetradesmus obliquus TaxID=3088 RepID=A0A383VVV6_TETOB|eukprot:jgi/Sobl393_1/6024/SZX69618.1
MPMWHHPNHGLAAAQPRSTAAAAVYRRAVPSCAWKPTQGRTLLGRASIVQSTAAPSAGSATASSCSRTYAASGYAQQGRLGVLLRTCPACVTAAAVPPSRDSSSSSSNPHGEAAADGDDADYADLAEDDNIILLGSADEEDDDYDSYDSAAAAVQRPAGQVVSSAMSEDEFRAAMAAARQQVLSGSSGSEEEDGWEQADDDDDEMRRSGEDFWSTEKERVYLVGVAYKQQYQQQQQQQQRRQQQQQQQSLFGSSSGGLGMTASSYSPWAAPAAAADAGDGSSSSRSSKRQPQVSYNVHESLDELGRLAETAGLQVVGSNYQALEAPNNSTYIGSGKVAEVARAVTALKADTVIFDDELSPGQLRNLEKAFSGGREGAQVAVADRTALILDIFSQRARTREGKLQVELAQTEYQLPRLTRMWSHLDRVAGGGQVKGTGEKQIEIDKRLLRDKAAALRRELQAVRTHRAAHRTRRQDAPIPVVALVGYTNAGKSTLLNTMTDAGVLAEDKLFATLDPTTRKVRLPGGNLEVLFSDTVGFIQKLPTQLVAAFRATLEEIASASVVLHVLDVSADNAPAQCAAVLQVLEELGVQDLPLVTAWNKIDACPDPAAVAALAASRADTVAISGATGEGLQALMAAVAGKLAESMVEMEVLLPYSAGALLDELHKMGKVSSTAYTEQGTRLAARVPLCLVGKLQPYCCTADGSSTAGSTIGSVTDDGDNGQLETLSEDEIFTDYIVDNASLEGVAEDGYWDGTGSEQQQQDAGDRSYVPRSAGSRAGKRAEQRRRQQHGSSLAQHQLPPDWQDLIMSGSAAGSGTSSPVTSTL